MNHHKTHAHGTIVDPAPLFASVWLALFNELRKTYSERHLATSPESEKNIIRNFIFC